VLELALALAPELELELEPDLQHCCVYSVALVLVLMLVPEHGEQSESAIPTGIPCLRNLGPKLDHSKIAFAVLVLAVCGGCCLHFSNNRHKPAPPPSPLAPLAPERREWRLNGENGA
jgi:hypothetical protein